MKPMNNPILQSEGFERAAYGFRDAVAELTRTVARFGEEVQNFRVAVDELKTEIKEQNDAAR